MNIFYIFKEVSVDIILHRILDRLNLTSLNFANRINRLQIKNDMLENSNENNLSLIDAMKEKEMYRDDVILRQQDEQFDLLVRSQSLLSFRDETNKVNKINLKLSC